MDLLQVHAAIRADPAPQKKERSKPDGTPRWKPVKLTYDERKERLKVQNPFQNHRGPSHAALMVGKPDHLEQVAVAWKGLIIQ